MMNPSGITIAYAFPNPFNPTTTFRFDIPESNNSANVSISIFDIQGREVEVLLNEKRIPGSYSIQWNAIGYPTGMYFTRLNYGDKVRTQKIIFLK